MRIEPGNKKQLRWMIVLLVTAALAVIYDLRGFSTATSLSPQGTATSPAVLNWPSILQLDKETQLNLDLLLTQQQIFRVGERNIFRMQETGTKAEQHPDPSPNPKGSLSAEQPEPSLPFTFYGFADKSSEPRRIFLQNSQRAFLAKIGDTVAGHYKVINISPESVTLEDALKNYQQRIPLLGK